MISNETQIRVRYGETDQMGVVYHGNYASYLEVARVEWLRNMGVSYKSIEEKGIILPVVSLNINYKKPVYYDDVITIKTTLQNKPSVRLDFFYEIINSQKEIITTATTTLVFVNAETKKPTKAPQYILDAISKQI